MVRILQEGVPKDQIARADELFRTGVWPFNINPITCPDCDTVLEIHPDDLKHFNVSLVEDEFTVGNQRSCREAYVRCPHCYVDRLTHNIYLHLVPKHWWNRFFTVRGLEWQQDWKTVIKSVRDRY
jgi:uncharacterized C2H2 Zn-finger protein